MKKVFNKVRNDQWAETDICMAVIARYGTGGGNIPLVMTYQNVAGTLSPGGHPGSYNGQDAYNDLLVVDDGIGNGNGTGERRDYAGGGVQL